MIKKIKHKNLEKGAAMIIAVLAFLSISTTVLFGMINPIIKQAIVSKTVITSKQSYFLAQGVVEDSLYKLKNGEEVSSGDVVPLGENSATVSISNGINQKTITVVSNISGLVRKIESTVAVGTGTAFNYGIQTGSGGFVLNGGARVNGSVYSNGNIIATNGVIITGSAIAANSPALMSNQMNDVPIPPPYNINFRNVSGSQDFAQSFILTESSPINKVSLYIKKVGSPANVVVRIVNDSSGSPGTGNVFSTNGTLVASQVSTNYSWVDVVFPQNPELNVGTTYWLVLDSSSQNPNNYYTIGANNSYPSGVAKVGSYSGNWNNTNPSGLDGYFKIYLGGLTSTIGGGSYVGAVTIGSGGVGDAKAHNVTGASVAGGLYCQTGSNNNKPCNSSLPDPSPQGFPISEANIADWKDEAEGGGTINGNYTVGWAGATLGPKEITGNLVVNGGGTLTMAGTIWVHGSISVSGGGKIKLSSSYGSNSGVIIADGIVTLDGGGELGGSGQSGSYLMVLTTSDCPEGPTCGGSNALTLSGGAGAVILNAQNGNMVLNGGSGVKEATAYKITASGGAIINYETGLANINFSSGPSGGWDVSSWSEVP